MSDGAPPRRTGPLVVSLVSLHGSSGRTSTVVNLAWTFAASGLRVLVLDADATAPAVPEYLGALPGFVVSKGLPRIHRHLLPLDLGWVDVRSLTEDRLPEALEQARSREFDVVLIDRGILRSHAHTETAARECDVAVVCFRPEPHQVTGAWDLCERVRTATGGRARVVLVPGRVAGDHGAGLVQRLQRRVDDLLRGRLDPVSLDVPSDRSAWRGPQRSYPSPVPVAPAPPAAPAVQLVGLPFRTFALDTALAPLRDAPGAPDGVLDAYTQLAEAVHGPGAPRPRVVPARVRERFLVSLRLSVREHAERIGLLYLPRDRAWAEWICSLVQRAGLQPVLVPVDNRRLPVPPLDEALYIAGQVREGGESALVGDALARTREVMGGTLSCVSVRRDDPPANPDAFDVVVGLGRHGEPEATAVVQALLGLFAPGPGPSAPFPGGTSPANVSLRPRNPDFLGRGAELETMREALVQGTGTRYALVGAGGVGKSETAAEYAHRFAGSYDTVWWVPAHSRQSVRRALGALGRRVLGDVGTDPAGAVVARLSESSDPWLLVFDNADDLDALDGLVPDSPVGHVVVTTRHGAPGAGAPAPGDDGAGGGTDRLAQVLGGTVVRSVLERFDDDDAHLLVRRWLPSLPGDRVAELSDLVGHLPIALRLAVAWASTTAPQLPRGASRIDALVRCVERLVVVVRARLDEAGPVDPVRRDQIVTSEVVDLILTWMATRGENPATGRQAVRLARMCAFLSPVGVSLSLLCSQATLRVLGRDGDDLLLQDGIHLHEVLATGHRYGVFDLDRAAPGQLRMHRMVGELLRSSMDGAEHDARRADALEVLAAFAPSDAEGDTVSRSDNLVELADHLEPSGALMSDDPAVRRWVVTQTRFAYRWGDASAYRAENGRARAVAARWRERFGPRDPLYLRMLVHRANFERSLGHLQAAYDLDDEAVQVQSAEFGTHLHPRVLVARRGLAADLLALGRFTRALTEHQTSYDGFQRTFGPDHPDTLMAGHNLALAEYVCGRTGAALRYCRDVADRYRRIYGPTHPSYVRSMTVQAAMLRELGRFEQAEQALSATLDAALASGGLGVLEDLVLAGGRATSRRELGAPAEAMRRHRDVLESCRRILGRHHGTTLSMQCALALDHLAAGDPGDAHDLLVDALAHYTSALPESHPVAELCRADLALALRMRAGLDDRRADALRAVELGAEAHTVLEEVLGDVHPWALGAALDQAGHLAAVGRGAQAVALRTRTARLCEELNPEHPVVRRAQVHLAAGTAPAGPAGDVLFEMPIL